MESASYVPFFRVLFIYLVSAEKYSYNTAYVEGCEDHFSSIRAPASADY